MSKKPHRKGVVFYFPPFQKDSVVLLYTQSCGFKNYMKSRKKLFAWRLIWSIKLLETVVPILPKR